MANGSKIRSAIAANLGRPSEMAGMESQRICYDRWDCRFLRKHNMTKSDDPRPNDGDSAVREPASKSKAKTGPVSAKRVLIVDDDFEIIEAVRYALEAAGHEVVVARDGNQGLALAERENPDLMILDMMMPKRSGFLVLEKLRRLRDEPLPVIMITGNEGSRHKAYAELLGVSEYIRKPFAMDRLIDAVNNLLQ
jgi:CheY-like chemotaxis protein